MIPQPRPGVIRISSALVPAGFLFLAITGCSSNCEKHNGSTVERDFRELRPAGTFHRDSMTLDFTGPSSVSLKFKSGSDEYEIEYEVLPAGDQVSEERIYE